MTLRKALRFGLPTLALLAILPVLCRWRAEPGATVSPAGAVPDQADNASGQLSGMRGFTRPLLSHQEALDTAHLSILLERMRQATSPAPPDGSLGLDHQVAEFGNAAIPGLSALLLEHPAPPVCLAAARTLALIGTPEAVDAWVAALAEEADPEARDALARTLQALDNAAAGSSLACLLAAAGDDPMLATALQEAFSRVADGAAVAELGRLLREDPLQEQQRERLMGALGSIANRAAIPALAEILREDADPPMRQQAAAALAAIGEEEAVYALLLAVSSAQTPEEEEYLLGRLSGSTTRNPTPT